MNHQTLGGDLACSIKS